MKAFTPLVLVAALGAGGSLFSSLGHAQGGGPFAALAGSWSGGGTITLNTGASERIRCRVSYAVSDGGNTLQQNLRCASDSYRFDLASNVTHRGGSISGTFSETSRGVGGHINGRVSGGRITALAEGTGFSAQLSVTTNGNQQSVSINSPGMEVSQVSVQLRKGG
jgi:hypothetical protein